ncbi:MAG: ABC transporter substrate-binding protein [Alphaproteobacteria bacterium]|nr:ABC transporter substrate-binding protein [Alphaproteobacteria bacterium]
MKSLLAAVAGVLALASAGAAVAQEKVSLRLNWILIGQHPAYYLGAERGFYKQAGIDLTINEGRGSGVAVQLVANGEDQFGLADAGTVVAARAKGAPVSVIMSLFGVSNLGVIARPDAGITDARSLIGKKIAVTPGDALTQVFPALLKANNIDRDKVELVFMDAAAKPISVLDGKTHALLGGIDDQAVTLEGKGMKPAIVRFADYGANSQSVSLLTSLDMIKNRPDTVRRFVAATTRSWQAAMKEPEAAVDAAMKAKPGMDRANLLAQLKASLTLIESAENKGKPFGWGSDALWEQTMDLMKTYRELKTDVPTKAHYDYSFLAPLTQ